MLKSASVTAAAAVTTIFTAALLVAFSEFWRQRYQSKKQKAELSSGFERLVLRCVLVILLMMRG